MNQRELLAGFDFPSRRQVDGLWAKEAEERIDAYERGDMGAIPVKEVFDRIDGKQAK